MNSDKIVINIPLDKDSLKNLKAGDEILLNGIIFSARDQAHQKMDELLNSGQALPFPLQDTLIYYMGPSPTQPGEIIGSAGPTTSGRMDKFTPRLLDLGLPGMVGKGPRSSDVTDSLIKNKAVYFYAFGGCGALYAEHIIKSELTAFPELGPEAVFKLEVKDFPLITAIDSKGGSIFK